MSLAKKNVSFTRMFVWAVCMSTVLAAHDSYAYLDPNAGGWLYQMLFPVLIAISGAWVLFQRYVVGIWRSFVIRWQSGTALRHILPLEIVQAFFMLPAVSVGVILPIEFLAQVNGYLGYMKVWELFPVFGWEWLFFALASSIVSLVILGGTHVIAKYAVSITATVTYRLTLWLSVSLLLIAFLRGMRLWFVSSGFTAVAAIPYFNGICAVLTFMSCAFWVTRSAQSAYTFIRFARFSASVGLVLTLLAPVITLQKSPLAGLLPKISNTGESAKHPNIILVTVDALTATHMSLYGYEKPTTPNLVALANEADVYERFYSNSNFTTSGINSIIHGVRPWTHRALQLQSKPLMVVARNGLVARLKSAGYQTSAVSTNMYAAPFLNLSKQYFDQTSNGQINRVYARITVIVSKFPHMLPLFNMLNAEELAEDMDWMLTRVGVYTTNNQHDPERAFSMVRKMIRNRKADQPFFTWVHLYPPNSPYASPEPFIGRFDTSNHRLTRFDSSPPWYYLARADTTFPEAYVGRYDESVAYVDEHIGKFISWLKSQNVFNDTLILISADHGESFSHQYGAHSGPAMHEDLINIPLIIKPPNQLHGRRISLLSEQVDLLPTILEYAGLPESEHAEGTSLTTGTRRSITNRPIFTMNFQQNYCFGELNTGTVAMIHGDWKYVHYMGDIQYPMMPELTDALYNLRADRGELTNLLAVQPAIAREMLSAINTELELRGGDVD